MRCWPRSVLLRQTLQDEHGQARSAWHVGPQQLLRCLPPWLMGGARSTRARERPPRPPDGAVSSAGHQQAVVHLVQLVQRAHRDGRRVCAICASTAGRRTQVCTRPTQARRPSSFTPPLLLSARHPQLTAKPCNGHVEAVQQRALLPVENAQPALAIHSRHQRARRVQREGGAALGFCVRAHNVWGQREVAEWSEPWGPRGSAQAQAPRTSVHRVHVLSEPRRAHGISQRSAACQPFLLLRGASVDAGGERECLGVSPHAAAALALVLTHLLAPQLHLVCRRREQPHCMRRPRLLLQVWR